MSWILRNPPEPLWKNFTLKAKREGWPLKDLILRFAQDFVDGKITPSVRPPVALSVVAIPHTCKTCGKPFEIEIRHAPGFSIMDFYLVDCPHCGAHLHLQLPAEPVNVRTVTG